MISIIIPLYNKEQHIANTLQTVFNQTFQDFEIVIVDDGSTDGSVEEVEKFDDSRIRLIHQENAGVSAARNRGIQEAKYDLIAFLDADDEWKPEYLQTQYELAQKYPECSVFACAYEFRDYKGNVKKLILNKIPFQEESGILSNYFEVAACSHPPLWTSAVMVKKEAIVSVGSFPLCIKAGEDLLTWAELAVKYTIAYHINPKAYFVQSIAESYGTAPSRIPQKPDIVGKKLEELYASNSHIAGLQKYVSLWYKMRASMFLLLGDTRNTLHDSFKSLKYNVLNYKVWAYICLLAVPAKFRHRIFQKLGNA